MSRRAGGETGPGSNCCAGKLDSQSASSAWSWPSGRVSSSRSPTVERRGPFAERVSLPGKIVMIRNEALLRSVIESPDDDTPRLVYADRFEENGEPERAEFIRVQCSLDKLPPDEERCPMLRHREAELLGRYGWAWAEELAPRIDEWLFRRGFVEGVQMRLETSAEEILSVLNLAPIRHIRDLSQLTGLELWTLYAFDDNLLAEILASPHLANLRTLILHHDRNGNVADEEVIAAAMHSPYRSNLEELAVNVDGMWRGPPRKILKAIATSPYLRNLRRLNLSNAGDPGNHPEMDVATIRALGESPNLQNLETLDLGQTSFPIEAWDEVLKWPLLSRLSWLRLSDAQQVNPPSILTVAKIEDLSEYREAFERKVKGIDWESEFVTPWDGNASWKGLSRDG
jgi:uncharacterized protein (TIGR02996 family)